LSLFKIAVAQLMQQLTGLASSLASQLPQVLCFSEEANSLNHCGSWLASDGGKSVDILAG
jgi:hypothetical protein